MRTRNRLLLAGIGLLLGSGGFAATQGTLGATSTGTFTTTFDGSAPRQVQVLGLQDALVTPDSPAVAEHSGAGAVSYGVADQFCVVDTSGGSVELTVMSSNGFVGGAPNLLLATSSGGSSLGYTLTLEPTSGGGSPWQASESSLSHTLTNTVTDAASCGAGNVRKAALLQTVEGADYRNRALPPNGHVYTNTVIITVSPL